MNTYFSSLASANGTTNHLDASNQDSAAAQFYEADYNRRNFSSTFDRLTAKDSLMGNYSNLNMMPTTPVPSSSHHPAMHLDPHQATHDYSLSFGHPPSASMNDLRSQQLSNFSMAVSNPMLYYAHPWMRPGRTQGLDDLSRGHQIWQTKNICIVMMLGNLSRDDSVLEFNLEHKRTRQTYTRHQTLELEKEFHYTK